jgi:hypothetical protein
VAAAGVTTPAPLPAGLDPAYVRAIANVDAAGHPQRWEGGPFHHCFGPGLEAGAPRAVLEGVADNMVRLTGIPRTTGGACNVTWKVAADPLEVAGGAQTVVGGNAVAIYGATVTFLRADLARPELATHESGHVLGLRHSPIASDAMASDYPAADFSANELAVLAWMYGR